MQAVHSRQLLRVGFQDDFIIFFSLCIDVIDLFFNEMSFYGKIMIYIMFDFSSNISCFFLLFKKDSTLLLEFIVLYILMLRLSLYVFILKKEYIYCKTCLVDL